MQSLRPDEQVYVLKNCPPAQSIGKTVVDQGHLFAWDPREDVPYLVPPDDISRCTIKVPRRARINATRVVEYVTQYDETVIPKLADQPSNLQPVEAAASPGAAVDGDDAVSVADGKLFEAEPPPIPPPEAPPVPPHRDDEVPLAELADGEPSDERVLRAAANSPEHLRSHFPKNPFCRICAIAKNTAARVARKPDGRADDGIDNPTAPFQQLATDSVILAKGDEHAGIGVGGIKSHHVIRDVFSGARIAYPVSKRDTAAHSKNLRHFLGLKANELSPTCLVKMDEAGELEAAAHEVGLTPETSLPNRWPHNAELERDIREEKECCRSIHLQSGLPYDLHTHSYPFACLSMSFDRPATFDKAKTQWEALTKSKFDGIRHCFGQLVYYRKKGINKRTLEPNLAPALFLGWRVDAGLRYRHVVKVLDYQEFRTRRAIAVHDVPEAELFVEEGEPCFPVAAAAHKALRTGEAEGELPEVALKEVPFSEVAAPPTPAPGTPRGVYITVDRIIRFRETPGCRGCTGRTRYHTPECRRRFARLVDTEKAEERSKRSAAVEVERSLRPSEAIDPVHAAKKARLEEDDANLKKALELSRLEKADLSDPDELEKALRASEEHDDALRGKPAPSRPGGIPPTAPPAATTGAAVTTATATSTSLTCHVADSFTKREARTLPVFGVPCSKREPCKKFPVGNKRARKRIARGNSMPVMFEYACSSDSTMGAVHQALGIPHVRLAKEHIDLETNEGDEQLTAQLQSCSKPNMWAAIPCTSGSPWQRLNVHKYGNKYKQYLRAQVKRSEALFARFTKHAEVVIEQEGHVTFEWPRDCKGWERPDVKAFFEKHASRFHSVTFHGCAVGLTDKEGTPIKKPWRLMTTSKELHDGFQNRTCPHQHSFKHAQAAGSNTARTAFYPQEMCKIIASALYPHVATPCAPAMPVQAVIVQEEHREKEQSLKRTSALSGVGALASVVESDPTSRRFFEELFDLDNLVREIQGIPKQETSPDIAAMVTKLLSRSEMLASSEALQAIKEEADGLGNAGVWDLSAVREQGEVAAEARRTHTKVHFGQLMTIASFKFFELAKHLQKVKGRIVYRGDCARDEYGAAAVYQELGANPTSVQGLNNCLAYGSLPGHKTTAADAVKAYIQALLRSQHQTWISLPPELRPKWWKEKFIKRVVLLVKALYGHPDAGGLWEQHFKKILKEQTGEEIQEFPGNFYFPQPA